jgi:ribosomal protein L11 methyltransferase
MRNEAPDSECSAEQSSDCQLPTADYQQDTPQRWHCLSVTVPHEAVEAVANFLMELGSTGVVEGVRDPSQPLPLVTEVQGFFPFDVSGSALRAALDCYLNNLSTLFPNLGSPISHLTEITSASWFEHWREHFPPLAVGARFLILPPWEPLFAQTDRLVIVIDPSMAFGTGHHATTQGCLEAIESLCFTHGAPATALDLGTGSGILAIALAKLGVQTVWATDIDPVALNEVRKNIEMNHVTSSIHFSQVSLGQLPTPFPLVVANLFASTLVALAADLCTAVERSGYAILSGIQTDQEADVQAVYTPPTWDLVRRLVKDDWVTLVLRRT